MSVGGRTSVFILIFDDEDGDVTFCDVSINKTLRDANDEWRVTYKHSFLIWFEKKKDAIFLRNRNNQQ